MQIDAEITAFTARLARNPDEAMPHLEQMVRTAREIGGKLAQDVEQLKRDFYQYQKGAVRLEKIQEDAIRIKHEVRPL